MLCQRDRVMPRGRRSLQSPHVQSLRAFRHRRRPGFPWTWRGSPGSAVCMAPRDAMAPLTEAVLGLRPSGGKVQRPRAADAGLAGLDEFRQGDVDDTLTAGLGTGDAQEAVDLLGQALTRGPWEFVAEKCV